MRRVERLERKLRLLEADYRKVLVKALTECAEGRWGLFGQNEHLDVGHLPKALEELRALARVIDEIRLQIGDVPFPLHLEFESARGRGDENAIGEPRLARAWLERLGGGPA